MCDGVKADGEIGRAGLLGRPTCRQRRESCMESTLHSLVIGISPAGVVWAGPAVQPYLWAREFSLGRAVH
jgi:hypothetical protein